ncbi:hypothetical protein ACGVWS_15830, partial [Enterobacteriaceae bacterium LUAb1]
LSPTRKAEVKLTDNGTPFAYSMTSHKNIKVNAEVQPPLQLPGVIIFVHGVNSDLHFRVAAVTAMAKQNYDIHMPDGKILSGVTDSSGNSSLIMSKAADGLKIVLKKQRKEQGL